jgi:hypothetical protein
LNGLLKELETLGFIYTFTGNWCIKALIKEKKVDFFFPEDNGENQDY